MLFTVYTVFTALHQLWPPVCLNHCIIILWDIAPDLAVFVNFPILFNTYQPFNSTQTFAAAFQQIFI